MALVLATSAATDDAGSSGCTPQCLTGDVFGSERCDCGDQLEQALAHDRRGRPRRARLPPSGGARHRARQQDPRLRAAGPGAATRSRPTSSWASGRTCATTASARRSSATSASSACACSPTTRRRSPGLEALRHPRRRARAARGRRRTPATSSTCAPSRRSSATLRLPLLPDGAARRSDDHATRTHRQAQRSRPAHRRRARALQPAVTDRLLAGALEALGEARRRRRRRDDVASVPGAFELPLAASDARRTGRYDALVCLGAVVRGETPHFDFVASAAARGVAEVCRGAGPDGVRRAHHRHHGAGARALPAGPAATRATRRRQRRSRWCRSSWPPRGASVR